MKTTEIKYELDLSSLSGLMEFGSIISDSDVESFAQ
jgi:hypothetical protein